MGWLEQLRMRTGMLFQRSRAGARLDDELRFHIERQVAENIAAGMDAQEARCAALRSFGNLTLLREQAREAWSWNWLESFWRDLRYGVRTLGRAPGFTFIAIVVMALGIGANVALFTVVRGMLLRSLPFTDPNRLVMLYEQSADGRFPYNGVAGGVFAEWRKQNRSFSDLALLGEADFNISGGGQLPEKLHGASCTWNLFPLLGVRLALGRNFTEDDDQHSANGTVLLSWSLWQRRFGGDPAIVNQTISLNGRPYTIIGILPAWFAYPDASILLWTPVYHFVPTEEMSAALGAHDFEALGRLKPRTTAAQGMADLSVITRSLHDQHLDNPLVGIAANVRPLLEDMVGDVKRPLYMLLAAAGCVLLIACLNVANLQLARASARRRELAIRTALGGGRLRLLREHLMESFLLSAAGGATGLLLAYGAVEWLLSTRQDMTRAEEIHIDGVVAAFTVGVVVLCALFSGLISALSANDKRLFAALHESSQSHSAGNARTRLRKTLLAVEVGLTVVLLTCAGLLVKSYLRLRSSDMGCITRNVLTMRLDLFNKRYSQPAQLVDFYTTLLARVRALPGVEAAGFVRVVPGQGYWGDQEFTIVEHPPLPQGQSQCAINRWADPGYFAAMGIPILRGRTFDPARRFDQADEAIISASFARQYFPSEDPIGKHLHFGTRNYQIVGVVGDTRYQLDTEPRPIQYYPLLTGYYGNGTLVIRSSGEVTGLALPVQRIVQEFDHDLPVSDVLTMNQLLGKSTLDESFNATLLTAFAVLSLLLAAVGLFGVLSYVVAQRTGEIGIRIALGARRGQVLLIMLADGLRPALFGLAWGLLASAVAVRFIHSMLYETHNLDPAVFFAVATMLLLLAALACMVPAWRASRIDPMRALRME